LIVPNTYIAPGSPAEPPALPPGPEPGPPIRTRRWGRIIALTTLSLLGLGALGAGGAALGLELTRKPTAAEIDAAGTKELANRWRIRPAGEIFPPTIDYTVTAFDTDNKSDVKVKARRVGIPETTGCAAAMDEKAAAILTKHGCREVLRATYVDASGTLVTTVGIAVLPNRDQSSGAETDFATVRSEAGGYKYGLRAAGLSGTITERFGDRQRQELWLANNGTPYLFFRTSGWVDGRTTIRRGLTESFDFATPVSDHMIATFVPAEAPCKARGVRC
jgi:hypothetical protein